jgi:hypothetical protein
VLNFMVTGPWPILLMPGDLFFVIALAQT